MRIKIEDLLLNEAKKLPFSGQENWLEPIYSFFSVPRNQQRPLLQGSFCLTRSENFVEVQGSYQFSPFIPCSRCSELIQWPLTESIKINVLLTEQDFLPERNLSKAELDEYYCENRQIDLELILNEAVQLALPTVTTGLSPENPSACPQCHTENLRDCIYSSSTLAEKGRNPFARLKELKLSE